MKTSTVLAIAVLLAVAGGLAWVVLGGDEEAAERPQGASSITITSYGGAYAESQQKAFFAPFTAETGIDIVSNDYNGELSKIKAMVQAGDITWDVVDVESEMLYRGCDEGIYEEVPENLIDNPDDFLPNTLHECGVGNILWSTVVAYDADRVQGEPAKLEDFFDLERFPGKRAVRKTPKFTLEHALMADGVPPDRIYAVLSERGGVERALAKLDAIKSQVVWWEAGAQPPQLLADGEVTMAQAYNGRIYNAQTNEKKNFRIIWDGQVYDGDYWVVPKGTPKSRAAWQFIAFATDARRMAEQTKHIAYAPTRKSARTDVPAEVLPHLPTAEANFRRALQFDSRWWADHFEDVNAKFQTWLAQE